MKYDKSYEWEVQGVMGVHDGGFGERRRRECSFNEVTHELRTVLIRCMLKGRAFKAERTTWWRPIVSRQACKDASVACIPENQTGYKMRPKRSYPAVPWGQALWRSVHTEIGAHSGMSVSTLLLSSRKSCYEKNACWVRQYVNVDGFYELRQAPWRHSHGSPHSESVGSTWRAAWFYIIAP